MLSQKAIIISKRCLSQKLALNKSAAFQKTAGLVSSTKQVLINKQSRAYASDDLFMSTSNAAYIDEMYESWVRDPSSVHASWNAYFKNMKNPHIPASKAFQAPPLQSVSVGTSYLEPKATISNAREDSNDPALLLHLKAQLLCRAYQVRGHLQAHIDPLGISFADDKTKRFQRN